MYGQVDIVFSDPFEDGVLSVGPGKEYPSLQSAINALPAVFTKNLEIRIDPGTYLPETVTITGKDTGSYELLIQGATEGVVVNGSVQQPHVAIQGNHGRIRLRQLTTDGIP